jgi:hypothetical protein
MQHAAAAVDRAARRRRKNNAQLDRVAMDGDEGIRPTVGGMHRQVTRLGRWWNLVDLVASRVFLGHECPGLLLLLGLCLIGRCPLRVRLTVAAGNEKDAEREQSGEARDVPVSIHESGEGLFLSTA